MLTAVVTGADGFIGKALLKELSNNCVNIYAVVRNESVDIESIKDISGVNIIYCDMNHIDELPDKINQTADVFFHLAWFGSTGDVRGDYDVQLKNVDWTINAVRIAKKLGCQRFVGAGTLAELDVNAYIPLDYSKPNKVSCYGVAKIAAHYMSKIECHNLGIEHLWAYISNTYGPGNYTSNFVNFAAKILLTGQAADFTSGEQFYDFVYINDVAQALYCIAKSGQNNCAYYIGSGRPGRLKDFIKTIRDEIDPKIQLNLGAIPFNGVAHPKTTFDSSKLMKDTGYQPTTCFEAGIAETVSWIKMQIEEGRL